MLRVRLEYLTDLTYLEVACKTPIKTLISEDFVLSSAFLYAFYTVFN